MKHKRLSSSAGLTLEEVKLFLLTTDDNILAKLARVEQGGAWHFVTKVPNPGLNQLDLEVKGFPRDVLTAENILAAFEDIRPRRPDEHQFPKYQGVWCGGRYRPILSIKTKGFTDFDNKGDEVVVFEI